MKMTQSLAYVILPNELIGKGHEVLLHELNGLRYLIQMFKGIIELSKKVSFPTRTYNHPLLPHITSFWLLI